LKQCAPDTKTRAHSGRLQEHVKRLEAWREKIAPGAVEAARRMMRQQSTQQGSSVKLTAFAKSLQLGSPFSPPSVFKRLTSKCFDFLEVP
jgi:hypothetical protein